MTKFVWMWCPLVFSPVIISPPVTNQSSLVDKIPREGIYEHEFLLENLSLGR